MVGERDKASSSKDPPSLRKRARGLSRLTWRILAINLFAVAILFVGVLYLDRYQNSLIEAELDALSRQGHVFARALGEVAVVPDPFFHTRLHDGRVSRTLRRIGPTLGTRARVFAPDGRLIADSAVLSGPGGGVKIHQLPVLEERGFMSVINKLYDQMMNWLPSRSNIPLYLEMQEQSAKHYQEAVYALRGDRAYAVRAQDGGGLVISVAVPVQEYRQILGALMLSREGDEIDEAMRAVRLEILGIFAVVITITTLLSLYLAGSITGPIVRLAHAAENIREHHHSTEEIPDFTKRKDEIGDLSRSIREMTAALRARIDAIESFAADVAHEIKNPLTSLRSAVETVAKVEDPGQRQKLMDIIKDDVDRVDRLISDISDASRLDAELSREDQGVVDITGLLKGLAEVYAATEKNKHIEMRWEIPQDSHLAVIGFENRLVQVVRNIVTNAIGFSPEDGTLAIKAWEEMGRVYITVEDDGPGIPDGKLEAIFDRFYTERPSSEKFGTHSGLGLSISKQIIDAHNGTIRVENRMSHKGEVIGARFVIQLPALSGNQIKL